MPTRVTDVGGRGYKNKYDIDFFFYSALDKVNGFYLRKLRALDKVNGFSLRRQRKQESACIC